MRWILLAILTTFSCSTKSKQEKLIIATAANVQFAMEALEKAFEEESNILIETIVSSSGKLTAQIRQGAPYDVFISANRKYPEYLLKEGYARSPIQIYAQGKLVLWSNIPDLIFSDLSILNKPLIRKIAVANPRNAPYGIAAMEILRSLPFFEDIENKLVFGESIAQSNQYILSGVCELGFTAQSVVKAPQVETVGRWIEIDTSLHQAIEQAMVITNHGKENCPSAAQQFFEFMQSEKAQSILEKYGYLMSSDSISSLPETLPAGR